MDIQGQKPWTKNQVSNEKNNVPKSSNLLSGYIAGSFNGGHNRTIAWKKVMAGEKHKEYKLKLHLKMLTPLTPTYQNLKCTVRAYFVPNSRVWINAEKYTAQKGGATEIKIAEIPNTGGKNMPTCMGQKDGKTVYTQYSNTTAFRDTYISSYFPRLGNGNLNAHQEFLTLMPAVSILPLRGRKAIYNDFERNKEYDQECQEFFGDTVTEEEWNSYFDLTMTSGDKDYLYCRAKRQNSYYSDYRTELQGFDSPTPNQGTNQQLTDWLSWENLVSEARSEATNANLNDWDIIAKIRGSQKLSEGKVQILGERTFNLNYSAITQNTYNNNEDIDERFRVLGQQGAYSYTEVEFPIYAAHEFKEEGYIHIIATVSADSIFEGGWDRNELNITPFTEYRPDLLTQKDDILYNVEFGTYTIMQSEAQGTQFQTARGFKRKYSEYFKLPNIVQGDMTTEDYWQNSDFNKGDLANEVPRVITNKTFQFFEIAANYHEGVGITRVWKDYTDYLINKNLAVKYDYSTGGERELHGQNQVFFVGVAMCDCVLPIDESIKTNYTHWGEH